MIILSFSGSGSLLVFTGLAGGDTRSIIVVVTFLFSLLTTSIKVMASGSSSAVDNS